MKLFYSVIRLKYEGYEKKGFIIDRPNGTDDFLFLHFKTPVNILQDGKILSVSPGTCLITSPTTRHWFEAAECELVHDWVHFMPDNIDTFLKLGLPVNRVFNPSRVHFITPAVMECESEFIHKELYWEVNISSKLSTLFVNLARETENIESAPDSEYLLRLKDEFKQFRLMLYGQAGQNWDVDKMANELSLSRSRFTVLYRKFFGTSPKEDLIAARIEHAKYLLCSSNIKIDAIAALSGYTNVYHFIRQFRAVTNVSPGAYRSQQGPVK